MALAPGTRVGPYEVRAALGAGGMGEVYRAHDSRLGREVALKVLPTAVASDPDRLRRFEVEARAAGALNHPGILAVFDVGQDDGIRYVVSELLEGETLRERLSMGGLPLRKGLEYAIQVAQGLSAIHEKGIVHRDLKPENLFITRDGRAKILDLGLAKLVEAAPKSGETDAPTRTHGATDAGMILGTIGYMSPEQVRGLRADARSDIFAFGCVLYEILGRRRAFQGETAAETMTAILRDEPPPLEEIDPTLPLALDRVVKRCMEKKPEERFQSALDVAFAMDALSTGSVRLPAGAAAMRMPRGRRGLWALGTAVALAALVALGIAVGQRLVEHEPIRYRQITFRRGTVGAARFSRDGQAILYSAAWEGRPTEIFSTRPDARESRPLGVANASLLSVSTTEMAVALDPRFQTSILVGGTLARVSLEGGTPRAMLEDVSGADWAPDGERLAVVHQVDDKWRLEYPAGTALYETDGFLANPAVSPDGDQVAFTDFSASDPGTCAIAVVDSARHKRTISGQLHGNSRPHWAHGGREVWFGSSDTSGTTSVFAVDVSSGRSRIVTRFPGVADMLDVGRDGRALLARVNARASIYARAPGATQETDLSWLDASNLADISADGRTLVFTESMVGGGVLYGVYLRRTDGSPAVRLGDGRAHALSPDGKWVLTTVITDRLHIMLLPTGAGEPREIAAEVVTDLRGGTWLPDSRRVIFAGNSRGEGVRLFMTDTAGARPEPIGPARLGPEFPVASPDGASVAVLSADGDLVVIPIAGGAPVTVAGAEPGELPIQWSADSRSLYVYRPDQLPARVYQVDVAGDRRRLFREIPIADPTGLEGRMTVVMTPDGASYAYSFARWLTEIFLVEGLR